MNVPEHYEMALGSMARNICRAVLRKLLPLLHERCFCWREFNKTALFTRKKSLWFFFEINGLIHPHKKRLCERPKGGKKLISFNLCVGLISLIGKMQALQKEVYAVPSADIMLRFLASISYPLSIPSASEH